MIDYKRIEEIYLENDFDRAVSFDFFRELAEEIYQDGFGDGYDSARERFE